MSTHSAVADVAPRTVDRRVRRFVTIAAVATVLGALHHIDHTIRDGSPRVVGTAPLSPRLAHHPRVPQPTLAPLAQRRRGSGVARH